MNTSTHYESNELIDRLPAHLKQFIIPQNYDQYTPINQAVWRYVMRKNVNYLSKVAHSSYVEGLRKTGIGIEDIPSMYGMNRILKEIGWAAVAVDGFIPPNAFMEFQAYKVLVIACDMRQLENIEYTPAPDIVHEAAGHAPIIANPDYAEYLRRLGDIGAKAILSKHDIDLYEAVRKLSILKEAEGVDPKEIEEAGKEVDRLQAMKVEFSEMTQMRNLQWWSVEYGLIGDMEDPKIYGAGLLSSIGESEWCMSDQVKKLPYTIDAANQGFDITKPQPQLFVTPSFSHLMEVLEDFSNTLSLRKGGTKGINKLIESGMVGTIELNNGLQVSGQFSRVITNEDNEVIFYATTGPTALAYREKELIGHGIDYHAHGYSSPLGKLKNISLPLEDMGPHDLKAFEIFDNVPLSLEFESGIKVEGVIVTGIRDAMGKLLVIQFEECTVTYGEEVLFKPEYGTFDMAVGSSIISAYAGSADHTSFPNLYEASKVLTIKAEKSAKTLKLEELYATIRQLREEKTVTDNKLQEIYSLIDTDYTDEWLITLEILELAQDETFKGQLTNKLHSIIDKKPKLKTLITDGLNMLKMYA